MPRPLRAFLRIRLNAANVRVSIRGSRDLAFSRSDSSSCRVSDTISSSSIFFLKDVFVIAERFAGSLYISGLVFNGTVEVVYVFFAQFDFKCLEFHFLGKEIKFAVVTHIVKLFLISGDFGLSLIDFLLFR